MLNLNGESFLVNFSSSHCLTNISKPVGSPPFKTYLRSRLSLGAYANVRYSIKWHKIKCHILKFFLFLIQSFNLQKLQVLKIFILNICMSYHCLQRCILSHLCILFWNFKISLVQYIY